MSVVSALVLMCLLAEIVLLIFLDYRIYKTFLTPTAILSVPFGIVVISVIIWGNSLGFQSLYVPSLVFWIIGIFSFWIGGLPFLFCNCLTFSKLNPTAICQDNISARRKVRRFLLIFVPITSALLFKSAKAVGGLSQIGVDEFQDIYNRGLSGHLTLYIWIAVVYYLGSSEKILCKNNWIAFLGIGLVFLRQVKYHVIFLILSIFLYRLWTKRLKLSAIKSVIIFVFLVVTFFFITYALSLSSSNCDFVLSVDFLRWCLVHFLKYIWGSVILFGLYCRDNLSMIQFSPLGLIAPIYNIIRKIPFDLTLYSSPYSSYYFPMGPEGETGNVLSLVGQLYITLGAWGMVIAMLFLGLISYTLFYLAFKIYKGDSFILISYLYVACTLFMGFFGYYGGLLSVYEITIITLVLNFLQKGLRR